MGRGVVKVEIPITALSLDTLAHFLPCYPKTASLLGKKVPMGFLGAEQGEETAALGGWDGTGKLRHDAVP